MIVKSYACAWMSDTRAGWQIAIIDKSLRYNIQSIRDIYYLVNLWSA